MIVKSSFNLEKQLKYGSIIFNCYKLTRRFGLFETVSNPLIIPWDQDNNNDGIIDTSCYWDVFCFQYSVLSLLNSQESSLYRQIYVIMVKDVQIIVAKTLIFGLLLGICRESDAPIYLIEASSKGLFNFNENGIETGRLRITFISRWQTGQN